MSHHLSSSPWFLLEKINRKNGVVRREYIENPFWQESKKKGFKVGQWLLSLKPDIMVINPATHKQGVALTLLEQAGVEMITERQRQERSGRTPLPMYNQTHPESVLTK